MSDELVVQQKAALTTGTRGVVLHSFEEMWRFALCVRDSGMAPKDAKSPAAILIAIQSGAEVGLPPMQSIQSIAVINGRPTIWGDAARGLCEASQVCEYITETFDGKEGEESFTAVCVAKRRGRPQPTTQTFSIADAKRANLWAKSGPWQQYPKRMLQMRARGFALRDAFPDVLKGLILREEAEDYPPDIPLAVGSTVTVSQQADLNEIADALEGGRKPFEASEAEIAEAEADAIPFNQPLADSAPSCPTVSATGPPAALEDTPQTALALSQDMLSLRAKLSTAATLKAARSAYDRACGPKATIELTDDEREQVTEWWNEAQLRFIEKDRAKLQREMSDVW